MEEDCPLRKPDIVCIGAQKAGTSWIHEVLGSREDVWVPPFKEMHFFDHKFVEWNRRWTGAHVFRGVEKARTRHLKTNSEPDPKFLQYLDGILQPPMFNGTWYRYIFSRAPVEKICMDVTPEYCTIPDDGVDFFRRFLPNSKVLMLIRDPVERAISHLRMNVSRQRHPPQSVDEWIELAKNPQIRIKGDYSNIVPRWDKKFPKKQLEYYSFHSLVSKPAELLSQLETFLDLPPTEYKSMDQAVHKTSGPSAPDEVIEYFTYELKDQVKFISERFGARF